MVKTVLLMLHKVLLTGILVVILGDTAINLLLDMPRESLASRAVWLGLGGVALYLQGALLWMVWGQEPRRARHDWARAQDAPG